MRCARCPSPRRVARGARCARSASATRPASRGGQVPSPGRLRELAQHGLVQPRIDELRIGAACQHRLRRPIRARHRRSRRLHRYAVQARLPPARTLAACRPVAASPARRGHALVSRRPDRCSGDAHLRVRYRLERGVANRDVDRRGGPQRGSGRDGDADGLRRLAREPACGLPPEGLVGAIGRRHHHLPAPAALAAEDHRAAASEPLHGDERHGASRAALCSREHRRTRPRRPERRRTGQRRQRQPAAARLGVGRLPAESPDDAGLPR